MSDSFTPAKLPDIFIPVKSLMAKCAIYPIFNVAPGANKAPGYYFFDEEVNTAYKKEGIENIGYFGPHNTITECCIAASKHYENVEF